MFEWIIALSLFVCLIISYFCSRGWKKYAKELEKALKGRNDRENRYKNEIAILQKTLKETSQYKSNKRLEYLERYINEIIQKKNPDTAFIATFEVVGMDSIESQIKTMFRRADREIIIVSPWIKRNAWNRVRPTIQNFINNGGKFEVFMKGEEEDFLKGFSDRDVVNLIKYLGGEVKFIPKLHAKVVVVDRQEAIITSANFTTGGLDLNYEGGIWTRNPIVVNEVCGFIDKLRNQRSYSQRG